MMAPASTECLTSCAEPQLDPSLLAITCILVGAASDVMQTTRWVNGPGTSAYPERGRQLWDAEYL